jgi:hypothetical protein
MCCPMTLRVVGAGIGRTGTHSLKLALERLLGAPCYHMIEVFNHPEHLAVWHAAAKGDLPDWEALFDGYDATVDWPSGAFWRELTAEYPDAVILLSVRENAEAWWRSADRTIFEVMRRGPDAGFAGFNEMVTDLMRYRFSERFSERDSAIAAYEAHNQAVRDTVAADRLVEWQPRDGWEPLCTALAVPVPDEPFPKVNTTDDVRAMAGLDAKEGAP